MTRQQCAGQRSQRSNRARFRLAEILRLCCAESRRSWLAVRSRPAMRNLRLRPFTLGSRPQAASHGIGRAARGVWLWLVEC